ncbi:DUF2905 domain-containing protein [Candidatus Binatia bacterium]|nr:DUF2905 domain-containing protein [Candidatus Binatia bacterium]
MSEIGRTLIALGVLLVVAGGIVLLLGRTGVPFGLGRLPGDVLIKRDGFTFYMPITTSILISVVVTAILWLLRR